MKFLFAILLEVWLSFCVKLSMANPTYGRKIVNQALIIASVQE